jgi:hypothetical protein
LSEFSLQVGGELSIVFCELSQTVLRHPIVPAGIWPVSRGPAWCNGRLVEDFVDRGWDKVGQMKDEKRARRPRPVISYAARLVVVCSSMCRNWTVSNRVFA